MHCTPPQHTKTELVQTVTHLLLSDLPIASFVAVEELLTVSEDVSVHVLRDQRWNIIGSLRTFYNELQESKYARRFVATRDIEGFLRKVLESPVHGAVVDEKQVQEWLNDLTLEELFDYMSHYVYAAQFFIGFVPPMIYLQHLTVRQLACLQATLENQPIALIS